MDMLEFIELCTFAGRFDFDTQKWSDSRELGFHGTNEFKDRLEEAICKIRDKEGINVCFLIGSFVFGVDDNEIDSFNELNCFKVVDPSDYEVPPGIDTDFPPNKPMF